MSKFEAETRGRNMKLLVGLDFVASCELSLCSKHKLDIGSPLMTNALDGYKFLDVEILENPWAESNIEQLGHWKDILVRSQFGAERAHRGRECVLSDNWI